LARAGEKTPVDRLAIACILPAFEAAGLAWKGCIQAGATIWAYRQYWCDCKIRGKVPPSERQEKKRGGSFLGEGPPGREQKKTDRKPSTPDKVREKPRRKAPALL